MATNPRIIQELTQMAELAGVSGKAAVQRVFDTALARIRKQDETLDASLTVRDHYAMAALTGIVQRPDYDVLNGGNSLEEAFTIADLMMELRRG